MPYKDKAVKNAKSREWRKEKHTPAYLKWLYARRKLSVEKVVIYEMALDWIYAEPEDVHRVQERARKALEGGRKLERGVGNRFDHELDKPYYKEA